MIRVVHDTRVWLPQTQTWIYTQVTRTPAELVESHVVCERTENLEQFPLARLHDFSAAGAVPRFWDRALRRARVRRHLGYLARITRRVGARIVHSHFGDWAWTSLGAVRAASCRHVVTFYGYDMSALARSPLWRRRYAELFSKVDLVLCEGPHMGRQLAALGCPEHKIGVHHLGVRLDELPFAPRQRAEAEPLKILIAATFTEKKGIPYALRALGRLRAELDFEVTLIGDARKESPESLRQRDEIYAVIEEQRLGPRVKLLGYQPHAVLVREAYRHHVFLSPSVTAADGGTEGGLPAAIIEMLASGMLVIATRHCDIPEAIRDEETGWLADERDVEGLASRLLAAVRQPQRWLPIMTAGRQLVETEFDATVQGRRLAMHYQRLVDGRSP